MILNNLKLERTVTFIKCITSAVPLIFPLKTFILNKTKLPASSSLKVQGLVQNDLEKTFSEGI